MSDIWWFIMDYSSDKQYTALILCLTCDSLSWTIAQTNKTLSWYCVWHMAVYHGLSQTNNTLPDTVSDIWQFIMDYSSDKQYTVLILCLTCDSLSWTKAQTNNTLPWYCFWHVAVCQGLKLRQTIHCLILCLTCGSLSWTKAQTNNTLPDTVSNMW